MRKQRILMSMLAQGLIVRARLNLLAAGECRSKACYAAGDRAATRGWVDD